MARSLILFPNVAFGFIVWLDLGINNGRRVIPKCLEANVLRTLILW